MLNYYFDQIYCVNLDHRKDRIERFDIRIKNATGDTITGNDATITRFSAIDGSKLDPATYDNWSVGAEGCRRSHRDILIDARENGYESILIFEDDVVFNKNFKEKLNEFMEKVPKDWHMLYFGGNHQMKPQPLMPPVYKIRAYTTHAYAVKRTLYDHIINVINKCDCPVDVAYCNHIHAKPELNTYGCFPNIAWQEEGYSDIEGENVDTRGLLGGLEND